MSLFYNVFGSEDSKDVDIMMFVCKIGNVAESKAKIEKYAAELQPLYDRKVNINFAVVNDGIVTDVFKGTPDEVNNSLFYTCKLHDQKYPMPVTQWVWRDPMLKSLRVMRILLSFISRTSHRNDVKRALAGTAKDKYTLLWYINFNEIMDLGDKNISLVDFRKAVAFQLGQAYLLNNDIEVYTKASLIGFIPALAPFLNREDTSDCGQILDERRLRWLDSFNPEECPQFEELRK